MAVDPEAAEVKASGGVVLATTLIARSGADSPGHDGLRCQSVKRNELPESL